MADLQNPTNSVVDEGDKLLKDAKDHLLGLRSCLNKYAARPEYKDFLNYSKSIKLHMDFLKTYLTQETSSLVGKLNSSQ